MAYDLNELLKHMVTLSASDLHLRVGSPPVFRVDGALQVHGEERLSSEWLSETGESILTAKQRKQLYEELAVDSSYAIESFTRFRINVFYQRGTISMAFRNIFTSPPTIESLGLPTVLDSICQRPQGLALVCGPTGSGKSSTLAAMLQTVNESRSAHVVTIEDPIEYLFRDDKSFITQREVGVDTIDYETALKNAMRQDPDIILIGEMRSGETMQTVLSAAETGHQVFTTVHANSSYDAISRIVDSFPGDMRPLVRKQLSEVLLASIYQRLLPRLDTGGRIAALEILIKSPRIRDLIEKNELKSIREEMERSVTINRMQTIEQSLVALVANKMVSFKDALGATLLPGEMKLLMDKLGISEEGEIMEAEVLDHEGIIF